MKFILLTFISLSLMISCGKSKDKEPPKEPAPKKVETAKKSPAVDKKDQKTTPVVQLKNIPICDKYVKFVCSCAKQHPESFQMKTACKSAKETYPQWKRSSERSNEEQEQIIKACQKSILIIKSTNQCDDIKM